MRVICVIAAVALVGVGAHFVHGYATDKYPFTVNPVWAFVGVFMVLFGALSALAAVF